MSCFQNSINKSLPGYDTMSTGSYQDYGGTNRFHLQGLALPKRCWIFTDQFNIIF